MEDNKIESKQLIVVQVGIEQFGMDIQVIDNIVRMQKITRVPKAKSYFYGVINLRGEIIPVMSLRRRFGMEDDEFTSKTRIIIIKQAGQDPIGFIVDMVKEVITLEEEDIEIVSIDSKDDKSKYITAVGKTEDNLISILNVNNVITEIV